MRRAVSTRAMQVKSLMSPVINLEWTPDGVIPAKDAAIAKPKGKPKKKRSKSKTSSQVTSARKNTDNVRKQLDAKPSTRRAPAMADCSDLMRKKS